MKKRLSKCLSLALAALMLFEILPTYAVFAQECNHTWTQWTVDYDATCEYEGSKSRYCTECWEEEYQTIPKKAHQWSNWAVDYNATCIETGEKSRHCTECWEEQYQTIPKTSHKWSAWKTVKKATPYVQGKATRECYYCEVEQSKVLPKRKMNKSEKAAKNTVVRYLKAARKYDIKAMNKCFAKKNTDYGYPNEKIDGIFKKHNKKLKWKVKNITKNGKNYTVTVSVTRPNFQKQAYSSTLDSYEWAFGKWGINGMESHGDATVNRMFRLYNSRVKKAKKKNKTQTVKFTVVKKGKKWLIKSKSKTIVDIATAYYWQGFDQAYDEFTEFLAWYILLSQ